MVDEASLFHPTGYASYALPCGYTSYALSEHIYDEDFDRDSNVIEVFVGRLRKKLDPGGILKPIETLRGRGYRIPENSR